MNSKRTSQKESQPVINVVEPVNITTVYNRSTSERTFLNSERNIASDSTKGGSGLQFSTSNKIIVLMCVLGIPRNLFVVAMYIRRKTTSTRAYIFALRIADTTTCVCVTVGNIVRICRIGLLFDVYVFNVMFYTCLLRVLPLNATWPCLYGTSSLSALEGRRRRSLVVQLCLSDVQR